MSAPAAAPFVSDYACNIGPGGTVKALVLDGQRLSVGDVVQRRDREHPLVGQIIAIDLTGLAWIKYAVGVNVFARLQDMERVA